MNQALYAHMNNKRKRKKRREQQIKKKKKKERPWTLSSQWAAVLMVTAFMTSPLV
jgi:chromatin remodeling complex protein RSC6